MCSNTSLGSSDILDLNGAMFSILRRTCLAKSIPSAARLTQCSADLPAQVMRLEIGIKHRSDLETEALSIGGRFLQLVARKPQEISICL